MCKKQGKYKNIIRSVFILTLAIHYNHLYSQKAAGTDSLKFIPAQKLRKITDLLETFSKEALLMIPETIVPPSVSVTSRNNAFFDSLKIKASRSTLTRKIYGFLVVNPDPSFKKEFTGTSDAGYQKYSGTRIRKIIVKRLNVFGVDINNPSVSRDKKFDNLLNKTHVNTIENIIRKNLLFSEGDRISPLTLSDNERLLRQLPYIDDARIVVVPVSDEESDVVVFTKDVYSLGAKYDYKSLKKGSLSVFEKNIFGTGQEFGFDMPFDNSLPDSPGFGAHFIANNIAKSFINLNVYYLHGLGDRTYGFDLSRKLVSSTTKYAGGISVRQMYTNADIDTLKVPAPLKYNFQDYWISRSFLINKESVSRIIIGARYTNNNVFDHPVILPESYQSMQRYFIFLASAAFSIQKYTKTNLIYSYGRAEDIPYGSLIKLTVGREYNEFKQRTYLGGELSFSKSSPRLGYFYTYTGLAGYFNKDRTEQGVLSLGVNYFSNLIDIGTVKMRNFVYLHYTRGFGRYTNENLKFISDNGFSGFGNDSIIGNQRLSLSLESVLFSPVNLYGFRFAFFGFSDFAMLSNAPASLGRGYALTSIGLGIRIRNDNLVFNTLQIRIGYYPVLPVYSNVSPVIISGEQLLHPANFDSGPPAIIPYK